MNSSSLKKHLSSSNQTSPFNVKYFNTLLTGGVILVLLVLAFIAGLTVGTFSVASPRIININSTTTVTLPVTVTSTSATTLTHSETVTSTLTSTTTAPPGTVTLTSTTRVTLSPTETVTETSTSTETITSTTIKTCLINATKKGQLDYGPHTVSWNLTGGIPANETVLFFNNSPFSINCSYTASGNAVSYITAYVTYSLKEPQERVIWTELSNTTTTLGEYLAGWPVTMHKFLERGENVYLVVTIIPLVTEPFNYSISFDCEKAGLDYSALICD
jgi:hypothetical protein